VRRSIVRQVTESKFKKPTPQQRLYIKTISIHSSSQLEDLKENLSGKEPIILIARIAPIVSRDPEAASKLVNELYLTNIKNSYSVFRLGEERFMVVPNNVQVEGILLWNNKTKLVYIIRFLISSSCRWLSLSWFCPEMCNISATSFLPGKTSNSNCGGILNLFMYQESEFI